MSLKAKAVWGVFWVATSSLGTQLLSMLTTLILAKLLVPSDFGLIAVTNLVVSIVQIFRDLGLAVPPSLHSLGSSLAAARWWRAYHLLPPAPACPSVDSFPDLVVLWGASAPDGNLDPSRLDLGGYYALTSVCSAPDSYPVEVLYPCLLIALDRPHWPGERACQLC